MTQPIDSKGLPLSNDNEERSDSLVMASAGAETHPPIEAVRGVGISISDPSSKVFRKGIALERDRAVRLLLSDKFRDLPCEDGAALIMNGIHWSDYAS